MELSVEGGGPLLGGLSGVCRVTMVETAGTNAVFSRLDLDLLSCVDGSLRAGVIPDGFVAIPRRSLVNTQRSALFAKTRSIRILRVSDTLHQMKNKI